MTRDTFDVRELPGRNRLQALGEEFRRAVSRGDGLTPETGRPLFEELFGKLSREMLRKPRWLLILDGPLFGLPIAALGKPTAQGSSAYLVTQHTLRQVPGAGFAAAGTEELWKGPYLGIADPIYNLADPRRAKRKEPERTVWNLLQFWRGGGRTEGEAAEDLQMPRLAGSLREIQACARQWSGSAVTPLVLTGAKADLGHFQSALEQEPAIIHFATHVVPAPWRRSEGAIALTWSSDGPELLGTTSISRLQVRPRLVILSGCGSGAGQALPGEGLMGLTRAWLRAGAAAVNATLWPTPDDTGEMLAAFTRRMKSSGQSIDRALQGSQIEMLESGTWRASPKYWAGYFLVTRN